MDLTEYELGDAFRLPEPAHHPATWAKRVLAYPEHHELVDGQARIGWLMRCSEKIKGGRRVLGTAYMPRVPGELNDLFLWMLARTLGAELPDFLIVIDQGWWDEASDRQREILVFHELSHCVQARDRFGDPRFTRDGLPIWALAAHDVEEFTSVAARYGAWKADIRAFVDAVAAHDANPPAVPALAQ